MYFYVFFIPLCLELKILNRKIIFLIWNFKIIILIDKINEIIYPPFSGTLISSLFGSALFDSYIYYVISFNMYCFYPFLILICPIILYLLFLRLFCIPTFLKLKNLNRKIVFLLIWKFYIIFSINKINGILLIL